MDPKHHGPCKKEIDLFAVVKDSGVCPTTTTIAFAEFERVINTTIRGHLLEHISSLGLAMDSAVSCPNKTGHDNLSLSIEQFHLKGIRIA